MILAAFLIATASMATVVALDERWGGDESEASIQLGEMDARIVRAGDSSAYALEFSVPVAVQGPIGTKVFVHYELQESGTLVYASTSSELISMQNPSSITYNGGRPVSGSDLDIRFLVAREPGGPAIADAVGTAQFEGQVRTT